MPSPTYFRHILMARFNAPATGTKTENLAGGEAYTQTPELELASILLTSFVQDQYYRSTADGITRLKQVLHAVDPLFAAQAAVYARTKFGMRSVSHVAAGEIAGLAKGHEWAKRFFDKIVHRPDDMTEILAYIYSNKLKETNAIRKGFAQAFARFDAYQLGKYRAEGAEVSLVDVANLVHPPHSEAVKALIEGTLKSTNTWEAKLSAAGQKPGTEEEKEALKTEAWRELVLSRKIGYFALLRNLRNILETMDIELVAAACDLLKDEKLIRKSLALPFRFFTAYQELRECAGSSRMLGAISVALDISVKNIPQLGGKSLVVVDHSGSMDGLATKMGKATNFQIGALLGTVLAKAQDADFMYFGDLAKYYSINPLEPTLSVVETLGRLNEQTGWLTTPSGAAVGHGTNFHAIFEEAQGKYDRIFIFSDMQGWVGFHTPTKAFADYKRRTGADPFVYSIDLSGYGTMQFPQDKVFALAGFSEKVFEVMRPLEQDRNALISEIRKVEI